MAIRRELQKGDPELALFDTKSIPSGFPPR